VKQLAVYLMASQPNGTLYVGVTSYLVQRAGQHRCLNHQGFAARHGCTLLVWFKLHATMTTAIMREKQIKASSRARKLALVEAANPA
jgi:putative endonuclease